MIRWRRDNLTGIPHNQQQSFRTIPRAAAATSGMLCNTVAKPFASAVAVVAGMASRSSVGLRMTAGDQQLERYVIEFYSKSVK
ncbi:uncharacterized protein HaLaN_29542, partial [Haematococcus lacustris]